MTDFDADGVPMRSVPRLIPIIKRYRKLIFFLGLGWFGLVLGAGIFLSTLDARSGLHVFGSEIWQAGKTSVLRVSLRELRLNKSKPMTSVAGVFVDSQNSRTHSFQLTQKAGPYLQGNVSAPERPGRYRIELTAIDEDIPLTAQFAVSVQNDVDSRWVHALIDPPISQKSDKGTTRFTLQPLDGVLANGLPDTLAITARGERGQQSSPVDFKMEIGTSSIPLPSKLNIQPNEVLILPIRPSHPFFRFTLKDGDSQASRQIKPVATQFVTRVPSPIVDAKQLSIDVHSLYRDGVVFVDLWLDNQWFSTTSGELKSYKTQVKLPLPAVEKAPQIAWIRAYRNAYLPGTARGGRHIVISGDTHKNTIHWLGQQLQSLNGGDKELIQTTLGSTQSDQARAQVLLGRLVWPEHAPPLLADSGETNRQTVSALKDTWQKRFVIALAGTGILVLLILGIIVGVHHREVQRRWVEAGGDVDGEIGTREKIGWEIGYIFLIVAMFIIGMIQLLLWIRW